MTEHSLANLSHDEHYTILIADEEYCPMDYERTQELINDVKRSWASIAKDANNKKGRSLEDLAVFLTSCIIPFDVEHDIHTNSNQFDGFVEVRSYNGNNPFLASVGTFFHAECKNENSAVDITHVQKVGAIMDHHHFNFSIIFSRKRVTGCGKYEAAQAYIITLFSGKEKRIINIPFTDIELMVTERKNFLTLLREKNKQLALHDLQGNTLETQLRKIHELYRQGIITEEHKNHINDMIIESYDER
ncbi:hypothetical protein [Paenibacillus ginsengarvi]|uniref:Restriction endonuclease n=1 Tax=Paenibacillus ginsengarvi TaxID=400777 RepID=A0A3B0BVJ7_9BACL|nr:hypothetical protein [Paenibacillus ginsengarvi]RKN77082.1 hypothetical protein D7M11_23965 [Paenibacillus ginsengarvi]